MKFFSHDVDPSGEAYEDGQKDSYQLRKLEFGVMDFVQQGKDNL